MFLRIIVNLLICFEMILCTEQMVKNFVGVYTDNGFDQTVAYQVADDLEKHEIENQILEILGLPERPKKNWTEESLRQPAQQFLLEMYEQFNDNNERNENGQRVRRQISEPENKLVTPLDERELSESDNIMTFMSSKIPLQNDPIFQSEINNMLWFNTTNMPKDLILMAAQIKLFKRKSRIQDVFELGIYSVIIQSETELGLKLISAVQIGSDYEGWLEINVTHALMDWIVDPASNKGLYISTSVSSKPIRKDVDLLDIGLTSITEDGEFKPFMVGFFKGPEKILLPDNIRAKRNTVRRRRKTKVVNPLTRPDQFKTPRSCRKLNFSVDFKKLNWQNWIIAPDTFESYFCSGDCSFPLNADMNTTNHAIIQTLVRLNNPDLPKPCCVPVALTSISVVYHFSEDRINMKKYNNMVVKNCGCL